MSQVDVDNVQIVDVSEQRGPDFSPFSGNYPGADQQSQVNPDDVEIVDLGGEREPEQPRTFGIEQGMQQMQLQQQNQGYCNYPGQQEQAPMPGMYPAPGFGMNPPGPGGFAPMGYGM